ncbi:hypothetical protein ACHAXR_005492 [Thalassiosira sp. AJA248-18]
MSEGTYRNEEAMIAQCLISMANKEPRSLDPPQWDDPSPVSVSISLGKAANSKRVDAIQMIPPTALPDPDQWECEKCSPTPGNNSSSEMVWDSKKARVASGQIDLLESIVPHDRKESALELLHENDHQINGVLEKVMQKKPTHGLNWYPATKKAFSKRIAKGGRKNFEAVSKRLKKTSGDCQAYYYSHFKGTVEYRKMKRALKRQVITRSSGSRDLSDVECASPTLKNNPSGNCFCEECDSKK